MGKSTASCKRNILTSLSVLFPAAALFLTLTLLSHQAVAGVSKRSWGRDPFVLGEIEEENNQWNDAGKEDTELWLTGILYRPDRSTAIINRMLVREGDKVMGARVILIERNKVVLQRNSQEIVLRLGEAS